MIHAWANSGEDEALDRATKLFDEVKNTTHPSSYTYAAYQIAWSRSGRPDAAQRVEDILTDMQKEYSEHRDPKSRPGAPNFSIAINCWAKMGAAERAEAMLTRMEELYRSSGHAHIKPTADCYKAAIMAWAMSGEPEGGTRAIQLLDRMERAHAKNHTAPPPKRACYHFTMVAVGRSNDDSKARQCFDLLQRMKEYPHTRPIDATYVIVLRSCTATGGSFVEKEAAFQIAMKVWEDYRRLIRNPREDVLDRFLMAVYRLHPANEKRDELLEQVFEDCPEDMLRSKRIQDGLFKAASKDAADRILARIEQGSVQHLFGHPLTEEHSES